MVLMLALPFRHYLECLVIPLILLLAEIAILASPPESHHVSDYTPGSSNCSSLRSIFEVVSSAVVGMANSIEFAALAPGRSVLLHMPWTYDACRSCRSQWDNRTELILVWSVLLLAFYVVIP